MYRQKILLIVLVLTLLSSASLSATPQYMIQELSEEDILREIDQNTTSSDIFSAGDIIAISFSTKNPTLHEPIQIEITLHGNPFKRPFYELFEIIDEYHGIVASPQGILLSSGQVVITSGLILIKRMPRQTITIEYYPVIVGNHSLKFKAGCHLEKIEYITVGFTHDGIMYPSLGCPSIISRDTTNELTMVISEKKIPTEPRLTITDVVLEDIHNGITYTITNQTTEDYHWIHSKNNHIEEHLILRYAINDIPDGFYNLRITTKKQQYHWQHAVKLQQSEPENYTIVQLTDIHLGKAYNLVFEQLRFQRIINHLNTQVHPDFIILSGDIVDWANIHDQRNFFTIFQNLINTSHTPVFTTPGNHERYEHRLIRLYRPFTNLSGYHQYINPFNDYAFTYGNINYILLDSGYEQSRYDRWITPESSGLTNTQIHLLSQYFGNPGVQQLITMHHPAVNNHKDKGLQSIPNTLPSGNNECITKNRKEFIDYCIQNNVKIILSGHTHKNKILDNLGNKPSASYEQPLFIQTGSSTLSSRKGLWRTIIVSHGKVLSYELSSL